MLEVAPEHWRGGNSAFTGGAWRIVYHGFDDLARLIPDISDHELANVDVGTYTEEQYYDDIGRLTEYRSDPDLTEILITKSFETGVWMREKGVRFQLGLGRQAFQVDGKFKFWGGLACHIWGGGKEMMKALHGRAEREGIPILYETPAVALLQGDRRRRRGAGAPQRAACRSARQGGRAGLRRVRGQCRDAGALSRARLGPREGAGLALQHRPGPQDGARYRRRAGRALVGRACLRLGPQRAAGRRSRCRRPLSEARLSVRHRRQCAGASAFSTRALDFHSYTYAKYGGEILKQPGMFAWQVFDQKTVHLLRDEYRIPRTTKERADTLEALAARLEGVDPKGFLDTVRAFNAAPRPDVPFNPNIHDGLRTAGLAIDKSNWAQPPRHAALRGLCRDDRHHLHLRRAQDHQRRAGRGRDRTRQSRACSPPARSSAGSITTTTPAAPG